MHYKKSLFYFFGALAFYTFAFYCFIYFGQICYMYIEYPVYYDKKQKARHTYNADVVIIGNSRAVAGFIPNQITEYSALNLGVGGSTPIIGFYTLKNYLAHNTPPKVLILSYSPDFLVNPTETFWQAAVKTRFLEFDEILEILEHARKLESCEFFERYGGGCNDMDAYTYFLNPHNFSAELYKAGTTRYKQNRQILRDLEESKGHFYYGRNEASNTPFSETELQDFRIHPLLSFYLKKLVALAQQHNILVTFYVMPHNEASTPHFHAKFLQDYTHFIATMQEHYGIMPLNAPYAMPNTAFGDASHLYRGAEEVTSDIYNRLKKLNIMQYN